ncbi:MAG TPA: hypothetical protein P5186_20260 [Candidatus Paceibacterota bacterium]|nr:hypothetical protein [Candidatus Paceibacterota bacterium]HRZ58689.1 hypothetical protein [Candidatus Paceibacterota bacterium]
MRTPTPLLLGALWITSSALAQPAESTLIDAPPPPPTNSYRAWPGSSPPDCPFPSSDTVVGVAFTGRHMEYTGADTWYPSWAADGNLYSPWTDGNVNGLGSSSGGENAVTGHATILGDDPLKLVITNQGVFKSSPRPYEGRYPCGSLVHESVWSYGTYCLHPSGGVRREGTVYNWPWMGPFVGFRWSTNYGHTWTQTPCTPEKPLFGESALNGEPVKIGAPHFADFGKAIQHSPDGKAYLVAQGASDGQKRRFAYNSWITADQVYLVRVTPSVENMNDRTKYEFFAGRRANGEDLWTSDFTRIQPIAEWRDHMGCVTMTYNAPLATITAGSTHPDYAMDGLTDGTVDGYPADIRREWCSRGENNAAMVRLTWSEEQTVDQVGLFDRPNKLDQIRSGLLVFSDGTSLRTGELPDEAKQGLQIKFPPKRIPWLVFVVNEVKPGFPNIGLSEIAVFRSQ